LISWGPSPRASQALMLVARARALIDGRLSPSIDDVLAMAEPILKHRMALTFAVRAYGESMEGVIGKLKTRIGESNGGGKAARGKARDQGDAARERRGPLARANHAAPDPRGAPHRRHRHPRAARPQAGRARGEFLAIPPLPVGRAGAP